MSDPTPLRRPPLTVAAALRRIAEDAVRRDPSLRKKGPAPDDEGRETGRHTTAP
jgi:hypothetical protein